MRWRHVAAAAHFRQAHAHAPLAQLPSRLATRKAAADDVNVICHEAARLAKKLAPAQAKGKGSSMTKDLAHKRPFLLASLVFGISYPAAQSFAMPEMFAIIWKMAAVGFLVPYSLRRHNSGEFALLAAAMGFWSLGDGLIEVDMIWGAIAFVAGHVAAIWLFLRHRRVKPVLSQKLLAVAVFVLAPDIAFFLAPDRATGFQFAIYTLFVAGMAACAWNSNFPRYRVGLGAMAFVASDLLIFARTGALADAGWVSLAIWVLYYGGVLMIATGVVTTLVKRGHYSEI
jgi:uncharacterized membrane protein YhhN